MRHRFQPGLLIATVLTGLGCSLVGGPGAVPVGREGERPKPKLVGEAKPPSSPATGLGPGTTVTPGGAVISQNSGTLTGIVRAPASVISQNSGTVISQNSGTVISQNSGTVISQNSNTYRVAGAPEEKPLSGLEVVLVDAAGHLIAGADGKPLKAVTDAEGRYRFDNVKPLRNVLLSVNLGELGELVAVVPREGEKAREIDIDFLSTLTTAYIVDKYVRTQSEPLQTLDKLPANVEAETRRKAADALARHDVAVPTRLRTEDVVQVADGLRQRDSAFNDQMEVVKKLMVAAGLSDLGAGRLATEVSLGRVRGLAVTDDKTIYINSSNAHRIWRLGADGRLYVAAGNGVPAEGSLDGKLGPEAGLSAPDAISLDGQGRLLIVESKANRVSRLERDGRLTAIAGGLAKAPRFAVADPQGSVHIVTEGGGVAEHWIVAPGEAPRLNHTFAAQDSALFKNILTSGLDDRGQITFTSGEVDDFGRDHLNTAYRYNPQSKQLTKVDPGGESVQQAYFDIRGNLYVLDTKANGLRRLRVIKPNGTTETVLDDADPLTTLEPAVGLGPDGATYRISWSILQRTLGGENQSLAGNVFSKATTVGDLALDNPGGLVFTPGGDMVVVDNGLASKIWRLGTDRSVTLLAGGGSQEPSTDGMSGKDVGLHFPDLGKTDKQGRVYFMDRIFQPDPALRRLDPDGKLYTIWRLPARHYVQDLAVTPDGVIYASVLQKDSTDKIVSDARVMRIKPGESPTVVITEPLADVGTTLTAPSLALDHDGALLLALNQDGKGRLKRWSETDGIKLLKENPVFQFSRGAQHGTMAVDRSGRIYIAKKAENKIYRYDRTADTLTLVAGSGASQFNGTGVDDSLDNPLRIVFNSSGDLFVIDQGHKQIKRISAADLD